MPLSMDSRLDQITPRFEKGIILLSGFEFVRKNIFEGVKKLFVTAYIRLMNRNLLEKVVSLLGARFDEARLGNGR